MMLHPDAIRRQFPFLDHTVAGRVPVYLDNAATTQKPKTVIDRLQKFYEEQNGNINRGMHPFAEAASIAYEDARKTVQRFVGAAHAHEIIFTRNATESINLIARSFGETLKKDDRIALSILEHHSNIVPWLQLSKRQGIALDWIDLQGDGSLDLGSLEKILAKKKTKLVTVTGLSNVLGNRTRIEEIIAFAHAAGAKVLIDAAQLVAHESIDIQKLDADFLVFSGHKIYAPTGIGVLFGKQKLLQDMPAFLGGGDMIDSVMKTGFSTAELPRKFEAGTPSIADAVALGAAIDWMRSIGADSMHARTHELIAHAEKKLATVKDLTMLGSHEHRLGCISFVVDELHPHDLTELLGQKGICLRAGHHCTQLLHRHLGIVASTRLSVAVYNTEEEIDACIKAIEEAIHFFRKKN